MESELQPAGRPKRLRVGVIVCAAAVGAALGGAAIAGAATSGSSGSTSPSSATATAPSNAPDPAKMTQGPGETLLTGTTADKVKAAALAAVPGGTIIRVETDSAGSPYEAHMTKADGTQVTVKVDADYKVTSTEDGFGAGGPHGGPGGPGSPGGAPASSSTSSSGTAA